MSYGILLLRLVAGLTVGAHGAQKLLGVLGGPGLRQTAGFFAGLGFRAPLAMAFAAGLAELGGGLLLAGGFITPLGALAVVVVMLNAIATVHWHNGFWNSKGGFEFNLLLLATAGALAATGGARFSLDALFGWEDSISGPWWGAGVLAVGALVSVVTLILGRSSTSAGGTVTPTGDGELLRRAA